MANSHLLILAEREAIAWVLANERMAFSAHRTREQAALQVGDNLLVYTTRGAFHNPTRDRGRVIGPRAGRHWRPTAANPVRIAGREFIHACDLRLLELTPLGSGVELAPLIPELSTFPNKRGWAMRLRRPLLTLTGEDVELLRDRLQSISRPPSEALDGYRAAVPSRQET